jgi:uncharacterized membrane protein YhaH (DUF805 family)
MSTEPKRPHYWLRLAAIALVIAIVGIVAQTGVTYLLGYSTGASILKGLILVASCFAASILVRRLR